MEIYGKAESIECESATVTAKKIEPSPPYNHEIFGKCLKFICKRDGEAIITKELDNKASSKCGVENSHKDIGDKLKAKTFYVLRQGVKAVKLKKVRFSGEHNARQFDTTEYTFAEISVPFFNPGNNSISDNFGPSSPFRRLTK